MVHDDKLYNYQQWQSVHLPPAFLTPLKALNYLFFLIGGPLASRIISRKPIHGGRLGSAL